MKILKWKQVIYGKKYIKIDIDVHRFSNCHFCRNYYYFFSQFNATLIIILLIIILLFIEEKIGIINKQGYHRKNDN